MMAGLEAATTACVTGSSGALGMALVGLLAREGFRVHGVDAVEPCRELDTLASFRKADIRALDWSQVVRGCSVVFHLAATVHEASEGERTKIAYETNTLASARLAEACTTEGAVLLLTSTVSVFGRAADGNRRGDESPTAPETHYAISKWLAEEAIRSEARRGLRYCILRFPLLYGPGCRGNMERMLRAIAAGRYWPVGRGEVRKSALYLSDAARALHLAACAQAAWDSTFVVAPPVVATLAEIHRIAYEAMGKRVPRLALPNALARAAGGMADAVTGRKVGGLAPRIRALLAPADFEGGRFAQITGFAPEVDLATGLQRTAEWITRGGAV